MTDGAWDHSTVGPYRLVQRLGEGGMGVVHLGIGPGDRAVAVKVLRAHVAGDPAARLRLAREVETLRRIRHPRVAEVLDADVDGPVPYVATRYVPGRTLDDLVRERGPMPIDRVVHTGRLLAEALRAIHAAGVVHRDVKPANVMLVQDVPVLIDFGIAHLADESRITVTGLVMGTPGYLSPELIAGGEVTAATDWWGWGGTLAFAATGRPPFGSGPIEVVLDRVRRGAADLTGLDPRLQSVVSTALAADPAHRPPGDWLVGALEDVAATVPTPSGTGRTGPDAATVAHSSGPPPPPPVAPTTPHRPAPTLVDASVARPAAPPAGRPVAQPLARPSGPVARPGTAPPPQQPTAPPTAPPAGPQQTAAPPQLPPPPGRPATLLVTALAAFSAMATVAPGGAIIVLFCWMLVARTADRSALAIWRRRYAHGPRSSDVPVTVLAVPWRGLFAAIASLFAIVLPVLVAASVAFLAGAAANGGVPVLQAPTEPVALALAGAAGGLTAWWGPGGGAMRRGSTWFARLAAGRRPVHLGLLVFLGFVVLASLIVLRNGSAPDFGPFAGAAPRIGG